MPDADAKPQLPAASPGAQILAWAAEIGFDRAGIAELAPAAGLEHYRQWIDRGDHAGMAYLARRIEERADARRLLPGARTAVVVALHYAPLAGEAPVGGDLWPRVARYARGGDYHELMRDRLLLLAQRITASFPGTATRPYVDTGPILERELAAAAGLGAVGKNTNLLTRGAGSWFLLGELLTTLDLAASPPVPYDVCGRCTRCLEACPTGALPAPWRLDARRCISYWTIEHRGTLPAEVRPLLGDWVFGCDVCQEVCPYNRHPLVADHPDLELPPERRALDLTALLRLDESDYVERFRRSPMKRAKRDGLRRNAAVAMGNRRDPRYVPALSGVLADASAEVRRHAAWALGSIGGGEAAAALDRALEHEVDPAVRDEMLAALELARPSRR